MSRRSSPGAAIRWYRRAPLLFRLSSASGFFSGSAIDEEIAAIRAEIKKQNAGTRKRTGTAEQQERVRVLREQRREAMTEIRKLKREAKENDKPVKRFIDKHAPRLLGSAPSR